MRATSITSCLQDMHKGRGSACVVSHTPQAPHARPPLPRRRCTRAARACSRSAPALGRGGCAVGSYTLALPRTLPYTLPGGGRGAGRAGGEPRDLLGEVEQLLPHGRRLGLALLQLVEEHCARAPGLAVDFHSHSLFWPGQSRRAQAAGCGRGRAARPEPGAPAGPARCTTALICAHTQASLEVHSLVERAEAAERRTAL